MKTLALIVTLMLHVTGLWHRIPDSARTGLTAADSRLPGVIAASDIPVAAVAPGALPIRTATEPLTLTATAAIAVDSGSGSVLYAQNAGKTLPIASVTKMATALTILSRHGVDEHVTVPQLPTYQTADELMGLQKGETYRLGDLITAALVQSANDAADTLAIYDAGSVAKFTARMNAKMNEWGIAGAHFASATGLQDQGNYASATALAAIARLALANPDIRDTVKLTYATITSTDGRVFNLTTTNQLLAGGQFYGIKTGYTPAAGECFVGLARISGHDVVTVVLGADDRFAASQTLANWISNNWEWL